MPNTAGGCVEIELPSPPGSPFASEKLLARDAPAFIISRVERALDPKFQYLRGAVGEAAGNVFAHYVGSIEGSGLVDKSTSRTLDKLAADFGKTDKSEQPKFFEEHIKPFIASLGTARR